ncbi:MAG: type II toxin-antitoxin system HipA family toxin [Pseudomonadota bacterium]|nr:type II toxin-antitoxin system HipA family toxin [Pseudomonadota bacterium]
MIRLDIWLTLPTGERLHAGELACTDADGQGRYTSAFRYTADYLADPRAFPLDPAGLPLAPDEFQCNRLEAPLMVLEDALPDDWGRRLLILRHGLPRNQQAEPFLLRALAGQGLGALAFLPPGETPQPQDDSATLLDLETLVEAARSLEQDGAVDQAHRLLLAAGSSPGGARPKALVRGDNGHWIAKFSSRRDEVDMVGLEAASLELARMAGLEVPEFRLENLAGKRRALLVKRFDLTAQGGRRHMLSLRALLQAGGYYVLRYADLIAALRRYGARPEIDVPHLYRQMVFNALLGNTDDHLKNFWMLGERSGYTLSPAFDLLPDVGGRREHVLLFDLSPNPPGPDGLAALGRKWGVSGAVGICEEVALGIARFREIAGQYAVPQEEVARFARDIDRRLSNRTP